MNPKSPEVTWDCGGRRERDMLSKLIVIRTLFDRLFVTVQPSPRERDQTQPAGEGGRLCLSPSLGDGRHGVHLGPGARALLGGGGLLRPGGPGGLLPAALLLLAHDDGDILALAHRLLAAHLLDGLVREVAHRRQQGRGGAGAGAGAGAVAADGADILVGEDGLGQELEVLVRDVGRGALEAGGRSQRVAPWPAGEGAAGVDVRGRVVCVAPAWDLHGGRGAV